MGFIYSNPNPIDNYTGDCVIRAISIAEGMTGGRSHSSYAMMGRDGDGDGRYSEDNFRYSQDRGRSYAYSRSSSRNSLVDKLEYMAQAAVDEDERRVLMDCANKLK